MRTILTTVVGSRAHGLETPTSDTDIRSVFVYHTAKLLSIGPAPHTLPNNQKKDDDDTSWELAHFLRYCSRGNPTMLEVLKAPPCGEITQDGFELRELFPNFLSKGGVFNAYRGYAHQQLAKLEKKPEGLEPKLKCAALRVLYNGSQLLLRGDFTVRIAETEVGPLCKRAKAGELPTDEFMTHYAKLKERLVVSHELSKLPESPNYDRINEWLLRVRKTNWNVI